MEFLKRFAKWTLPTRIGIVIGIVGIILTALFVPIFPDSKNIYDYFFSEKPSIEVTLIRTYYPSSDFDWDNKSRYYLVGMYVRNGNTTLILQDSQKSSTRLIVSPYFDLENITYWIFINNTGKILIKSASLDFYSKLNTKNVQITNKDPKLSLKMEEGTLFEGKFSIYIENLYSGERAMLWFTNTNLTEMKLANCLINSIVVDCHYGINNNYIVPITRMENDEIYDDGTYIYFDKLTKIY